MLKGKKKKKIEETKQWLEPDSHMAEILELSDQKFKTTMIKYAKGCNRKSDWHARTDK